jgi:hypothetical protein
MRKGLFILLIFCLNADFVFSQTEIDEFIKEISKSEVIESKRITFAGYLSELYSLGDSLNSNTSIDQKIEIFDTSGYTLKYYLFRGILFENDSIAFQMLKSQSSDSTYIPYRFGCLIGSKKFNEILFNEYHQFIFSKYFYGGTGTYDGIVFSFPKSKKKIWKQKEKELKVLWEENSNMPFKEIK